MYVCYILHEYIIKDSYKYIIKCIFREVVFYLKLYVIKHFAERSYIVYNNILKANIYGKTHYATTNIAYKHSLLICRCVPSLTDRQTVCSDLYKVHRRHVIVDALFYFVNSTIPVVY